MQTPPGSRRSQKAAAQAKTPPKNRRIQKATGQEVQTHSPALSTPETALAAQNGSGSPSPSSLGTALEPGQRSQSFYQTVSHGDPRCGRRPNLTSSVGHSWGRLTADIAMERDLSGQSLVTSITSVESSVREAVSLLDHHPKLDDLAKTTTWSQRQHIAATMASHEVETLGKEQLDIALHVRESVAARLLCLLASGRFTDPDVTESDPDTLGLLEEDPEPYDCDPEIMAGAAVLVEMSNAGDGRMSIKYWV